MENLTVKIYSSGTTAIYDSSGELLDGRELWYETGNKGGLSLAGGMFVPRDTSRWWEVKGTLRVAIFSGQKVVYEGYIDHLSDILSEAEEGAYISFMGAWSYHLMSRQWRKIWCDNRTAESNYIWAWQTAATAADKCTVDRRSRLRFLPKAEAWGDAEYAAVRYIMPGNINRITFDYDLTVAGGETWTASLYDIDNTSTEWSVSAGGSGSVDLDSTNDFTATTQFEFRYANTSGGAQTPASDGSSFLSITNLMVYGEDETGSGISLYTVSADAITAFSTLFNSDITKLTAMGSARTVEPYMTGNGGYSTIADALYGICQFGDGADAPWTVGLLPSAMATTPNGLPVLYTAAIPNVDTGYEYFVSFDDPNIVSAPEIRRDYDAELFNNAIVSYYNEQGFVIYLTSADDAGLGDATSIAAYGQRDIVLNLGNQIEADAINYGTRFVAQHKDPPWIVNGDLVMVDGVNGLGGQFYPFEQVDAYQKRIKIDGYDTFIVSKTRVDVDAGTVSLSIGPVADPIYQQATFAPTWNDPVPSGDGGASGARSNKAWWKRMDLIGQSGRKRMRDYDREHGTDTWGDFKRKNFPFKKKEKKSKP